MSKAWLLLLRSILVCFLFLVSDQASHGVNTQQTLEEDGWSSTADYITSNCVYTVFQSQWPDRCGNPLEVDSSRALTLLRREKIHFVGESTARVWFYALTSLLDGDTHKDVKGHEDLNKRVGLTSVSFSWAPRVSDTVAYLASSASLPRSPLFSSRTENASKSSARAERRKRERAKDIAKPDSRNGAPNADNRNEQRPVSPEPQKVYGRDDDLIVVAVGYHDLLYNFSMEAFEKDVRMLYETISRASFRATVLVTGMHALIEDKLTGSRKDSSHFRNVNVEKMNWILLKEYLSSMCFATGKCFYVDRFSASKDREHQNFEGEQKYLINPENQEMNQSQLSLTGQSPLEEDEDGLHSFPLMLSDSRKLVTVYPDFFLHDFSRPLHKRSRRGWSKPNVGQILILLISVPSLIVVAMIYCPTTVYMLSRFLSVVAVFPPNVAKAMSSAKVPSEDDEPQSENSKNGVKDQDKKSFFTSRIPEEGLAFHSKEEELQLPSLSSDVKPSTPSRGLKNTDSSSPALSASPSVRPRSHSREGQGGTASVASTPTIFFLKRHKILVSVSIAVSKLFLVLGLCYVFDGPQNWHLLPVATRRSDLPFVLVLLSLLSVGSFVFFGRKTAPLLPDTEKQKVGQSQSNANRPRPPAIETHSVAQAQRTTIFRKEELERTEAVSTDAKSLNATKQIATSSGFLCREQTEEWKGWMQIGFLLYHYYALTPWYNTMRVFIASYLFLTGYGHTSYFIAKADYSALRVVKTLFRVNFLVVLLDQVVNVPYLTMYFCAVASGQFLLIYALMGTSRILGIRPEIMNALGFIVITGLCSSRVAFDEIFRYFPFLYYPSSPPSSNIPVAFAERLSLYEWWFRFGLDRYAALTGMAVALSHKHIDRLWKYLDENDEKGSAQDDAQTEKKVGTELNASEEPMDQTKKRDGTVSKISQRPKRGNMPMLIFLTVGLTSVLVLYGVFGLYRANKKVYNAVHPYLSPLPIIAFVLLRNSTPWLRQRWSSVFQWVGQRSLELYLLQISVWASGEAKLVLIYTSPETRRLNFAIASVVFVFLSHWAFQATNVLGEALFPRKSSTLTLFSVIALIAMVLLSLQYQPTFTTRLSLPGQYWSS